MYAMYNIHSHTLQHFPKCHNSVDIMILVDDPHLRTLASSALLDEEWLLVQVTPHEEMSSVLALNLENLLFLQSSIPIPTYDTSLLHRDLTTGFQNSGERVHS